MNLLPVMVWFHGGGWMCGGSVMYGPDYLLDRDIVLVTTNYRLGKNMVKLLYPRELCS